MIPTHLAFALSLILSTPFVPTSSATQGTGSPAESIQKITIRLGEPARIGFPMWLYADLQFPLVARYPFSEDPRYFGSNRLEIKRDGQSLVSLPGIGGTGIRGIVAGSIAPQGSPENRLPLHLGFAIDRPGRYSVRWTVIGEDFSRLNQTGPREQLLAESNWLDFDVADSGQAERDNWLTSTLAAQPGDAGRYVGDYLPSLMAAMPDRRAAQAVLDGLYSGNSVIRSCALAALEKFPARVSTPLVMESLHQRGPSGSLAYFVSWHAAWFQDRRDEIVNTSATFLRSNDDMVAEGALRMLMLARGFDWKGDTATLRSADSAVEAETQALTTRTGPVAQALAQYLPGIKTPASRERLWRQIEQRSPESQQAMIALTWIGDPGDLSKLGDLLVQPGNPDPRGTDLASLPQQLVRAYGDASIPYLQRAMADSPYVWVRTSSAQQLALKGKVEAFRFFLDAITANRSYKAELVNWMHTWFHLPATDGEAGVTAFLSQRITDPKPPQTQDSPLQAAITRLKSGDAEVRKAAAQELIDLGPKSVENTINVAAYLIDQVIRRQAEVSADSWRDAALVLGRLRHPGTTLLTLYLGRDGAAEALIELGEPGLPSVVDVLHVGGPERRLLAAEVLSAIGGPAARDALTGALQTESDTRVNKAIQAALSRLGQKPSPAQIR